MDIRKVMEERKNIEKKFCELKRYDYEWVDEYVEKLYEDFLLD